MLLTLLTSLPLQALQLRVLAWDQKVAQRKLSIAFDNKSKAISGMHHFARSKPVTLPSSPENLRIKARDRQSKEGESLSLALKIPAGILNPLLLILPDENAPTGIKALVIEDSIKDFEWGTFRFINTTDEALVFQYEKESQVIPSDLKPVTVAPGGETRNMGVSIRLENKPKPPHLYSAIWKHRQDLRQLVIIVPSKDNAPGTAEFKFIVENKAVVEAQNKQP